MMHQFNARRPHRISIASGKGGVGKTSIAVNLAIALAQRGQRTLLVDYDPGTANVAMLLGQRPALTIANVIAGECSAGDALFRGPGGIDVLAGHSGAGFGARLGRVERARLDRSLAAATATQAICAHAMMVVDLPAGCSADTLDSIGDGDELVLVMTPEPTSFLDAFALIKGLSLHKMPPIISIISNMAVSDTAATAVFAEFARLTHRLLGDTALRHIGAIPRDPAMQHAVMAKSPCLITHPSAPASRAIDRLPNWLNTVPHSKNPQSAQQELCDGFA